MDDFDVILLDELSGEWRDDPFNGEPDIWTPDDDTRDMDYLYYDLDN